MFNSFRSLSFPILLATMVVAVALTPSRVQAAIVLQMEDATIAPNGSGFMDVFVFGTSLDLLDATQYRFEITGKSIGSVSDLEMSASQLTDEYGEANYIFSTNPDDTTYGIIEQTPTEVEAFDFSANQDALALGATKRLLARLNLTHILAFSQTAQDAIGESFTIELVSSEFYDPDLNLIVLDTVDTRSKLSGTVTVQNASAVPEPGSLVFLCFVGGAALVRRRRRSPIQHA